MKGASGAKLERAAGNINTLLPILWPKLREKDKWQAGETYAVVHASNRMVAAAGLRRALLRVKGFDFVPDTLGSDRTPGVDGRTVVTRAGPAALPGARYGHIVRPHTGK